jgi:hypothetical protein
MLEMEKMRFTNRISGYNGAISELQASLAQKRKEMAYMDNESRKYDKNSNLRPVPYSGADTSPHSIRDPRGENDYLPRN